MVGRAALSAAVAFAVALRSCHHEPKAASVARDATDERRVTELRAFEMRARAERDLQQLPSSDGAMGADPWALAPLADGQGYVGLLRGRSSVVVLDAELNERARLPAPRSPSGLALSPRGEVFVASSLDPAIAVYRRVDAGARLERAGTLELEGPLELRELAWEGGAAGTGRLLALDAYGSRVLTIEPGEVDARGRVTHRRSDEPTCRRPTGLAVTEHHRVVTCLFDHTSRFDRRAAAHRCRPGRSPLGRGGRGGGRRRRDRGRGRRRRSSARPAWRLLRERRLVRLRAPRRGEARRINVSELGVLTPKAIALASREDGTIDVTVVGYGSDALITLRVPTRAAPAGGPARSVPVVARRRVVAGVRAIVPRTGAPEGGFVMASPLLDGWLLDRPAAEGGPRFVPTPDERDARTLDAKLGEALVFTALMAPWNKSDGAFSRFTCETCHFEGTVDGRVHFTGRADVHAATKPLLGLAGNKPHFSRALDRDLAQVAMNEFRVANARTGGILVRRGARGLPWLAHLGVTSDRVAPRSCAAPSSPSSWILPPPPPALAGRRRFTETERRGASRSAIDASRATPPASPPTIRRRASPSNRGSAPSSPTPRSSCGPRPITRRRGSCPTSTSGAPASRRCAASTPSGRTSPTGARAISTRSSSARRGPRTRSLTLRRAPASPSLR